MESKGEENWRKSLTHLSMHHGFKAKGGPREEGRKEGERQILSSGEKHKHICDD